MKPWFSWRPSVQNLTASVKSHELTGALPGPCARYTGWKSGSSPVDWPPTAFQNLSFAYSYALTSPSTHGRLHGSATHTFGSTRGSRPFSNCVSAATRMNRAARIAAPFGIDDRSARWSELRWRMNASSVSDV